MAVCVDDVARLNRMITYISDASRVDAELSREDRGLVDVAQLLAVLAEVYAATAEDRGGPPVLAEVAGVAGDSSGAERGAAGSTGELVVAGQRGGRAQGIRNLLENAPKF